MDKEIKTTRVAIVEPLRGLAALAVVWFHFTNCTSLLPPESWLRVSGSYGWLGVQVFFVISGFIIPYSMCRSGYRWPRDCGTFVLKRVVRLDPPYLVVILLILGLSYPSAALTLSARQPDWTATQLLAHLGYLNAFLGYSWLNPVFWTLAIEFQYYLLVAFAFPIVNHRLPFLRLAGLAAICGTGFLVQREEFVFRFAGLFALGIATSHKYLELMSMRTYLFVLAGVTAVTWLNLGLIIAATGLATALTIAFVRVPPLAPLAFLGTVSYSLYLLHPPIGGPLVNFAGRFGDSTVLAIAILLAGVAVSLIAAYGLYRLVERPAQRWSSSIRYACDSRRAPSTGPSLQQPRVQLDNSSSAKVAYDRVEVSNAD